MKLANHKSSQILRKQVHTVSQLVGVDIVPSNLGPDVYSKTIADLRQCYRERLNVYTQVLQASTKKNKNFPPQLLRQFELIGALNRLDQYMVRHQEDENARTLVDQQFLCLEKLRDFLESGGKAGYFKLPTGYGKTVLFTEFIEAMDVPTLIVVPTLDLMTQTQDKFNDFASDLDLGFISGYAKEYGNKVTIVTYDSLMIGLKDGSIKPENYGCLILDEAHLALTPERKAAVKQFSDRDIVTVGFTATPKYSDSKKLADLLPTEIHAVGLREAIEDGRLCSMRAILAKTNLDLSGVQINQNGEYDLAALEKAINIEARNKSAVQLYRALFDGEQGFVNCLSVQHAKTVAKIFSDLGVPAVALVGELTPEQRKDIKDDFASGKIKILTGDQLLIAGIDQPTASFCINLSPTNSVVVAEQRGGRAARLYQDKIGTVVDIIDEDKRKNKAETAVPVPPKPLVQKLGNGTKKRLLIDSSFAEIRFKGITFAEILGSGEVVCHATRDRAKHKSKPTLPSLPPLQIEGLVVITDPDEVMRVVNNQDKKSREILKQGWLTARMVGKSLDISAQDVHYLSEKYWQTNPEWFLRNSEMTDIYFHPLLVPELKKEKDRLTVPNLWRRDFDVHQEFKVNSADINLIYECDPDCQADWIQYFRFPRRGKYYDPALIEKIKNQPKGTIPKGFVAANDIATNLRTTIPVVVAAISAVLNIPEWDFHRNGLVRVPRRNGDTQPMLCLKADLAKKVKAYLIKIDQYQFNTVAKIAEDLNISSEELLNFIASNDLASCGLKYEETVGDERRVFFKDQAMLVKEKYVKAFKWPSFLELAAELDVAADYLQQLLNEMSTSSHQIFYIKAAANTPSDKHLRPDLVAKLKMRIAATKPPLNWLNEADLMLATGFQYNTLQRILQILNLPESVKANYNNRKGKAVLYYSSEVVSFILNACDEIKKWPERQEFASLVSDVPYKAEAAAGILEQESKELLYSAVIYGTKYFNPAASAATEKRLNETKGWINLDEFRKSTHLEFSYFDLLLTRHAKRSGENEEGQNKNPETENLKVGIDESGYYNTLIHPTLKRKLEQEIAKIKEWKLIDVFANEINVPSAALFVIVKYFKERHRFVTVQFKKENRIEAQYINPDFEAKIKALIVIPEGYKNLKKLAAASGITPAILAEKMAQLAEPLKSQIRLGWDSTSQEVADFASLEVMVALNVVKTVEIPVDFLNEDQIIAQIVAEFGEGYQSIGVQDDLKKNIDDLRKECFADPSMVFKASDQKQFNYSRSFIHKLKTERLPAPSGWITLEDLKEDFELVVQKAKVTKVFARLMAEKAVSTRKYYDNSVRAEKAYLSPELAERIRAEV